jgi:polyisoprenoid-binding protein YceI
LINIKSDFFGKDGQNFKGYFKLTIKGITKDITIPFIFDNNIMKGEFTIDRRDFKVGGNSMVMGDKVTISIQVNFANN